MIARLGRVTVAISLAAATMSCGRSEERLPVLLHVPQDPTVTLKVWFAVGSQDDPAGKQGLALLTGQLISEASTAHHDYDLILEKLYPLASGYSIRVDREMTVLTGRTHIDNLDEFYGLFTDAYLRPAFKQQDFDRLKSNTLNFLKNTLRYQSDEELAKAALYGFVFEGTPYAHPPAGTVKSVESITLEEVKAFYRRHYKMVREPGMGSQAWLLPTRL